MTSVSRGSIALIQSTALVSEGREFDPQPRCSFAIWTGLKGSSTNEVLLDFSRKVRLGNNVKHFETVYQYKADESCLGSRHNPHAIFCPHQKSSSFSKTRIKNIVLSGTWVLYIAYFIWCVSLQFSLGYVRLPTTYGTQSLDGFASIDVLFWVAWAVMDCMWWFCLKLHTFKIWLRVVEFGRS
jgi:hypothetical protein